ncbi:MAG: PorT family protein [Muribaculaceae bacterium]|nr:PorT family protein [Muribaculaceae bacterium]
MMKQKKILFLVCAVLLMGAQAAMAQRHKDKLLNRPYADNRAWHLGFSVGMHLEDITFTHNGFVTEEGRTWFMEQPAWSPGFCVNGLIDFRLGDYFNLRLTPGMYFGNREIHMKDTSLGGYEKQNIKAAYVVLPVELKYSAMRWGNARPYLIGGVMPVFDVSKKRTDFIKLKSFDTYLSIGFGCDFYLPYFKLIPEVKFCFGLLDNMVHNRPDLADEPGKIDITKSISKAKSKMIVLTFYFE